MTLVNYALESSHSPAYLVVYVQFCVNYFVYTKLILSNSYLTGFLRKEAGRTWQASGPHCARRQDTTKYYNYTMRC